MRSVDTSWLMVFDNAEASELLHRYWPACGHGSILITTQDRKMTHRSRSEVKLFTLTVEEGSYLLLRQLPEKTKSQEAAEKLSRDISKEVGGLPLLLVGLAGHIIDSHASLPQTLQDMQQPWSGNDSIIASLSPESATFQYQRPIHMAFNVSVSRLPAVALSVLQIMSMLSPDSINENLVAVDISDRGLGVLGGQGRSRYARARRRMLD
ncbi:hypothetical protein CTA2_12639 [Colletotrichum tanaceti]|uniref:Uncharacterized protein n=1 Tax=Colletotrichum tanaceti TaxID=1306861 RepID=A0A4U6XRB6_9PEZI|nr:hypothetical protein CTA2_12639 [Colletotrichum tanaceti]TKW58374.1 hypothetical protein CTA1_5188 [Colletotrichum tanaceti]